MKKTVLELEELANKAVKAALNQQWQTAIELNQQYLEENPQSIEALNRLARALQETDQLDQAKQSYQLVLTIDPYNSIAQKNLDKLNQGSTKSISPTSNELFLEEPGRTKTTTIENPQTEAIGKYTSGQLFEIKNHQDKLALCLPDGQVFGFLNDQLSQRLKNLIELGNTYSAHLINSSETPQVFLRETHQSAAASNYISFAKNPNSQSRIRSTDKHHLLHQDAASGDSLSTEDDLDNWDPDSETSSTSNLDDDFESVSLEQLRENEDDSSY